jgi:MFS family permease
MSRTGGGLLSVFTAQRHLGLLWSGQMLSAIGDRLHEVALMWIAVEAVGGEAGLVAAAGTVTRLLLGLPAGVWADRWDRRRTMIAADVVRAAAVATLAVAGVFGPVALWHLALIAAVLGAFDSFFAPALQASLPALAPDPPTLQRANALLNVNHRLAFVLGPSLTGVLLALIPISGFFGINAATFAASGLAIVALGRGYAWRAPRADGPGPSLVAELRDSFHLVWGHRVLRSGIGLLCIWNVAYAIGGMVGLPLLIHEMGEGPDRYGYLMGAYGVGNVASNLWLASHPVAVAHRSAVLFAGGLFYGAGMAALAWSPSYELALVAAAVAAVGGPMTDLMVLMIIQTEFATDRIGKVFAFRFTLSRTSFGVGLALAAPVYELLPVRSGMAAAAIVVVVVSLAALLRFLPRRRPA